MPVTNALASLAVRDLPAASARYEGLLAPGTRPMPEVIEWQLPGEGGLQVCAAPERAGHGACTIIVSDIDETVRPLKQTELAPTA
jgi:hypothetical protein